MSNKGVAACRAGVVRDFDESREQKCSSGFLRFLCGRPRKILRIQ